MQSLLQTIKALTIPAATPNPKPKQLEFKLSRAQKIRRNPGYRLKPSWRCNPAVDSPFWPARRMYPFLLVELGVECISNVKQRSLLRAIAARNVRADVDINAT
jgi:hypothetical protein